MKQEVFLVTGGRAPVAVHLARLLKSAGVRTYVADSLESPLVRGSRMHDGFFQFPSLRNHPDMAAEVLRNLLLEFNISVVVPTCEEVLHLASIWQRHDMPARLFAPGLPLLEEVHNKYRFIGLCKRLGLEVPATSLLTSPPNISMFAKITDRLVFKPVWSRFATQTLVRPSLSKLTKIEPTTEQPWVAQEFVEGDELCAYAIAHAGSVSAVSAYRGLIRAGLGASVCFEPVHDPAVNQFVTEFVRGTSWTGQISFDLIKRRDGVVLPIECNPRATSGLHFFRNGSQFLRALMGSDSAVADVSAPQGIRLALWLYGWPKSLTADYRTFWRAVTDVEDVMSWPGDHLGPWSQLRPMAEIARVALAKRMSLQAASTYDIEWDGNNQSIIS